MAVVVQPSVPWSSLTSNFGLFGSCSGFLGVLMVAFSVAFLSFSHTLPTKSWAANIVLLGREKCK